MNPLPHICSIILFNLDHNSWQSVIEDDYPDFKHLECRKSPGLIDAVTRLDVLIMTPELNPADASGICLCFLYYADPDKIMDMRKLGRLIRHDNFNVLQTECTAILKDIKVPTELPSIVCKTRPKHERIRFDSDRVDYPAFFIELDYWMPL